MASSGRNFVCHLQRNLAQLKHMPRVSLANIKDFDEARKKKQRKGRGPGSGRGKTCGRGHKGQGQRGTLPYLGFEGGQIPFYLTVPKHGRKSTNPKERSVIHLSRLQYLNDCGRLPKDEKLTMRKLLEIGALRSIKKDGLKLLGGGAEWFQTKIDIEVTLASDSAIQAIERAGGKLTLVYNTPESLRAHIRPQDYPDALRPKEASPTDDLRSYYARADKRGYLADPELVEKLRAENRTMKELGERVAELSMKDSTS